jgi:hypothetical protein
MDDLQGQSWKPQRRPVMVGEPRRGPLRAPAAHPIAEGPRNRSWLLLAALMPFALIAIEAAFAGTALITPVDQTLLTVMRGLGAVTGLLLGIAIVVTTGGMGIFRGALTVLFLPLMIGYLFNGVGWRMADWWEFGLSARPFESARYPVLRADSGRKGARDTLEIDPFKTGEPTSIPIPGDQYEAVWSKASDYCITVQQRRSASGAIEIRTDGSFTLLTPPAAKLDRCENLHKPWSRGAS